MTTFRSREIQRFHPDASPDERKAFAKTLVESLDALGVAPTDHFVVMDATEHEDMESHLQGLREDLEAEQAIAEDARDLEEAVRDFGRGIVTQEELLEMVGERL